MWFYISLENMYIIDNKMFSRVNAHASDKDYKLVDSFIYFLKQRCSSLNKFLGKGQ